MLLLLQGVLCTAMRLLLRGREGDASLEDDIWIGVRYLLPLTVIQTILCVILGEVLLYAAPVVIFVVASRTVILPYVL